MSGFVRSGRRKSLVIQVGVGERLARTIIGLKTSRSDSTARAGSVSWSIESCMVCLIDLKASTWLKSVFRECDVSNNTIIKICGCTCKDDARFALQNGADWIGLNLVGGPRNIRLADALAILDDLDDPSRAVVLLSVEDETGFDEMIAKLKPHGVRRLQLYGNVTPRIIQRAGQQDVETIKVQAITDEDSICIAEEFLGDCAAAEPSYLLLDASSETQLGGTGRCANWQVIENAQQQGRLVDWPPQILAGGLNAENVIDAIQRVRPAGVDVSSGVESSPGRTDPVKVSAFIEAVQGQG